MVRVAMIILGALLLAPGLLRLGGDALVWLRVLDVGFALAAALTAFQLRESEAEVVRFGAPGMFAAGLFVVWLFALVGGAPFWQSWSNFGIASAFALLAYSEKLVAREDQSAEVIPFRRRAS